MILVYKSIAKHMIGASYISTNADFIPDHRSVVPVPVKIQITNRMFFVIPLSLYHVIYWIVRGLSHISPICCNDMNEMRQNLP